MSEGRRWLAMTVVFYYFIKELVLDIGQKPSAIMYALILVNLVWGDRYIYAPTSRF